MTATAMALLYGTGAGGKKKAIPGGGGIRLRRVVFLLLLICCSPILIPLLLLASPVIALLCFAAVCLRRPSPGLTREDLAPGAAEHPRALLHRYLEDQLGLALAFVEELRAE